MKAFRTVLFLAAIAALGCASDGEPAPENARETATEQARAYFEAFRAGDLDRACSHVARRMLPTTRIVGANTGAEQDQELPDVKPFGSPTPEGVRQFGGDWPKGQFRTP